MVRLFISSNWQTQKKWQGAIALSDGVRATLQAAADETVRRSWDEAESKSNEFLQKARDEGIEVIELSPEQITSAAKIAHETE
ncbi:hypothetical protein [Ruegeria sp. SCP11]|uniref:hypothetical protein n=1 Tax=Ruegeria sp. SCP11 TaxID=3141378 RepID=UPI00333731D5